MANYVLQIKMVGTTWKLIHFFHTESLGVQLTHSIAYGVGLIGLIVSACLYLHVASKYVFVRILRNSRHLQANTLTHWITWLGCTTGLGLLSWILAEAIPIFNYLIALTGSLCFAPIAVALPGWLWLHDHKLWYKGTARQKLVSKFTCADFSCA